LARQAFKDSWKIKLADGLLSALDSVEEVLSDAMDLAGVGGSQFDLEKWQQGMSVETCVGPTDAIAKNHETVLADPELANVHREAL